MISARSRMASGAPIATCHNARLCGQNQFTVKMKFTVFITTGRTSHTRYPAGVFHPAIKTAKEHTSNATAQGKKNRPVSTGKRGPYGIRLSDSGGEALQAPASTSRSNNLPPRRIPQAGTEIQSNIRVNRARLDIATSFKDGGLRCKLES